MSQMQKQRGNVELLQQSLQTLSETQQLGTTVLTDLITQGETLDRINEGVTTIEDHQEEAATIATNMSSWWSRLISPFSLLQSQPAAPKSTPSAKVITITKVSDTIQDKALLLQISGSVGDLKSTAILIGKEINSQNGKIDQLNNRITDTNINMKRLNKKINTL